jgi:long-chain acyl-CoA synthetase
LAHVNAKLEPHEKLDCVAVITTPWTPENGFVTPTLKVKRMRIEEAYASHYNEWLAQRTPVVWCKT